VEIEFQEIRDYLATCPPFDLLSEAQLRRAANRVKVAYFRAGSPASQLDYNKPTLYIVRTGAFELRSDKGELVDRVQPGGYFGYPSLLTGKAITNQLIVLEDGLVYMLDEDTFSECRRATTDFDRFFNRAYEQRLSQVVNSRQRGSDLTRPVVSLVRQAPVALPADSTIQKAAREMRAQRVSSILLTAGQRVYGIVTDRDLRNRVLAEGIAADAPLHSVMTARPICIDHQAPLFQAILLMSEHNIHHLPVVDDGVPCGVISTSDIVLRQRSEPIMLVNRISHCRDRAELKAASLDIAALLQQLVESGARAEDTGRALSAITDAITRQLIRQAEDQLGPAPAPYCWLAFGSQARREQTAYSDQDNGLLLANDATEEHDDYFRQLAEHVCGGLDDCGFRYCNGDIMAQSERWRQPLASWQHYFDGWIEQPDKGALMHASIFFDMRAIAGDAGLCRQLQSHVSQLCAGNDIFLAAMCQNALAHRPPLGLFRQFVLETDGEQRKTLDLKLRGVVPIVDIARVYALAAGIRAANTQDRLRELAAQRALSAEDAATLGDSLEYIAHLRQSNQARQLAAGRRASNFLNPDNVSSLVRHQLRDAFKAVARAQDALRLKFGRGLQ
jgi:CBS domain-containing protein